MNLSLFTMEFNVVRSLFAVVAGTILFENSVRPNFRAHFINPAAAIQVHEIPLTTFLLNGGIWGLLFAILGCAMILNNSKYSFENICTVISGAIAIVVVFDWALLIVLELFCPFLFLYTLLHGTRTYIKHLCRCKRFYFYFTTFWLSACLFGKSDGSRTGQLAMINSVPVTASAAMVHIVLPAICISLLRDFRQNFVALAARVLALLQTALQYLLFQFLPSMVCQCRAVTCTFAAAAAAQFHETVVNGRRVAVHTRKLLVSLQKSLHRATFKEFMRARRVASICTGKFQALFHDIAAAMYPLTEDPVPTVRARNELGRPKTRQPLGVSQRANAPISPVEADRDLNSEEICNLVAAAASKAWEMAVSAAARIKQSCQEYFAAPLASLGVDVRPEGGELDEGSSGSNCVMSCEMSFGDSGSRVAVRGNYSRDGVELAAWGCLKGR